MLDDDVGIRVGAVAPGYLIPGVNIPEQRSFTLSRSARDFVERSNARDARLHANRPDFMREQRLARAAEQRAELRARLFSQSRNMNYPMIGPAPPDGHEDL